jgi:ABC-type transport system substrate-binding protein
MKRNYWTGVLSQRLGRRRALAAAGATAAASAFLAACGGGGADEKVDTQSLVTEAADTTKQAKRGGTLKDRWSADTPTLDIAAAVAPLNTPANKAYSTLVREKPGHLKPNTGEITSDVAESWEVSPDGLQITMKLRQGVKWHNKAPVNARTLDIDDAVFSWNRFAAKSSQRSAVVNALNPDAPILSFSSTDSRTVVIKLKEPLVYALELFASFGSFSGALVVVPKETDSTFDIRSDMIGTGPFILSNYTPSVGATLKRNPEYWDKDFALVDQIDFPILPEYAAVLSQFKAGNIYGTTAVRGEDLLTVKREEPRILIYQNDFSANTTELTFGVLPEGKSPFLDERVRQAYSMSWDRDAYLDTFNNVSNFRNDGLPVETRWNSVVAARWDGWWLDPQGRDFGPNAKFFKHDPAEAKKLLAAAGYSNGFDTLSNYVGGPELFPDKRQFAVLDAMAAEVGIRSKPNLIDYAKEYIPTIRDAQGQFEGWGTHTIAGAIATNISPVAAVAATYWPKSGATYKGFSASGKNDKSGDPQLNALIERARLEQDVEKRRGVMNDLQRYMAKAMWGLLFPGGATGFAMGWPALRNYRVFRGPSVFTHYQLWVDETLPPFKA